MQPVVQPNPAADTSHVVSEDTVDSQSTSSFTLSDNDTALLGFYFGANIRASILKLHEKVLQNPQAKPASIGSVTSEPITDRQLRTQLHKVMNPH